MSNLPPIPFNRASFEGREHDYLRSALGNGHISGNGPFTKLCHRWIQERLGAPKVLLTTSCTHSLEMCALLLDIKPGDEVIVPSFTFVSTVNAFVLHGAVPVFADIRPDTLNIDEDRLSELWSPRTRAIVPVHYAGVACNMDPLLAQARERNVMVIEDNAHGFLGNFRGRPLGSFGALATMSFHETKNITCGEGGALVINDPSLAQRAEIIWEKGTDRSRFFRGEVDKYGWVDRGSSWLPSDVLAGFLLAQLERADEIQFRRRAIFDRYAVALRLWAQANGVSLPHIPEYCDCAWHMFYLLMPTPQSRAGLIAHLKERGILSVFHYQPLHLSPMGVRLGGKRFHCPVTEDVSERLLRLPFFFALDESAQDRICEATLSFRP